MNTSQAVCRMSEVIRRQHKATSTEECIFYRDILGQPYVAGCGPHGSLTVVLLIAEKRSTARLRGASGGATDGCAASEADKACRFSNQGLCFDNPVHGAQLFQLAPINGGRCLFGVSGGVAISWFVQGAASAPGPSAAHKSLARVNPLQGKNGNVAPQPPKSPRRMIFLLEGVQSSHRVNEVNWRPRAIAQRYQPPSVRRVSERG